MKAITAEREKLTGLEWFIRNWAKETSANKKLKNFIRWNELNHNNSYKAHFGGPHVEPIGLFTQFQIVGIYSRVAYIFLLNAKYCSLNKLWFMFNLLLRLAHAIFHSCNSVHVALISLYRSKVMCHLIKNLSKSTFILFCTFYLHRFMNLAREKIPNDTSGSLRPVVHNNDFDTFWMLCILFLHTIFILFAE